MATLAVSQIAKDDIDLARDLFSASQCGQAAVVRAQGSERGLHSLNCYPCGRLVLAIFEGHSGGPAAHLCREMIPRTLEKKRTKDKRSGNEHSEERERARLLDTFALAQTKVLATLRERKLKPHPGTTALVVILQPVDQVVEGQSRTKKLYVANAGDTHVFLYRNGKPIRLSSEHTAKDKTEKERVEAAGGWFDEDGFISGCLRLTRRLGGSGYPGVIATPDVRVMTIEPTDEVLIAGSLGVSPSLYSSLVSLHERLADPLCSFGNTATKMLPVFSLVTKRTRR